MKKMLWILVALGVIALAGCSSIPAKATEDESLVIIMTEIANAAGLPRGHEILFQYTGDYPDSWVGQYSWDFNLVVVREPGVMLASYGAKIQTGFHGQSPVRSVDLQLPYAPGQIAIADFVFIMKIEQTGPNQFTTSTGFRAITPQEKDDLMEKLTKDGRFATWTH